MPGKRPLLLALAALLFGGCAALTGARVPAAGAPRPPIDTASSTTGIRISASGIDPL